MTQEQLKAFLKTAKSNPSLQEMLNAAVDADAVVAIVNASGIEISADEPKKAQAEVSDRELEGVIGGWVNATIFSRDYCDDI